MLAFGIAKEIFDGSVIEADLGNEVTVAALKQTLEEKYPRLKRLATYMVAVNNTYAQAELIVSASDEIAIIPPVSGG